jgi:hypothetical protein
MTMMMKRMMMIKKVFILFFIGGYVSYAADFKDADFDGVPDAIDECPSTPFLNEVDVKGCTTQVLMLVSDTVTDSLVLSLKFGYSLNEDLRNRETQKTSKVRIAYYKDDWSYTLRTGYYVHNEGDGQLDTTFKIRKRFKPSSKLRVKIGASLVFPTRDFVGNNTDLSLSTSTNYYLSKKVSLFAGAKHTFVRDEQIFTPLQNKNSAYVGVGYFFTKKLYGDVSYAYTGSKFTIEHAAKSIGCVLSYDINDKWYTTLSYSQDIDDEDSHNALNFTIGYRLW